MSQNRNIKSSNVQPKSVLLKDYRQRLKDNIRYIRDNYREIVSSAQVEDDVHNQANRITSYYHDCYEMEIRAASMARAAESLLKLVSDLKQFCILNDFSFINATVLDIEDQCQKARLTFDAKLKQLRSDVSLHQLDLEEAFFHPTSAYLLQEPEKQVSNTMDEESATYVDGWQEYRSISQKLKKKFLRKHNPAEGVHRFNLLANRFNDNEVWQYSGFIKLAVARQEHGMDNTNETVSLAEAARFFLKAQLEKDHLFMPNFNENLSASLHCYLNAIKLLLVQNNDEMAVSLLIELAVSLYELKRPHEAIEYFDRAAYLTARNEPQYHAVDGHPDAFPLVHPVEMAHYAKALDRLDTLTFYCVARIASERDPGAPNSDLNVVALKAKREFGHVLSALRECEIVTILLLCRLEMGDGQLKSVRQKSILKLYLMVGLPSEFHRQVDNSFLDANEFLMLQSFVLALRDQSFNEADLIMTEFWKSIDIYIQELILRVLRFFKENVNRY